MALAIGSFVQWGLRFVVESYGVSQMSEQPGCVIAIAHKNCIVLEQAYGHADLTRGIPLTPRHRFRIASHSKSVTAAGVMKLRERGKLKLDDEVGHCVGNLNPRIARTTLGQVLSHSAGSDLNAHANDPKYLEDVD